MSRLRLEEAEEVHMTLFERQLAELNNSVAEAYGAPPRMAKALTADTKALPDAKTISGDEFMAKALHAQAAGFITGAQLAEAEQCINSHRRPPEPIVRAVVDGRAYSPWG